MATLEALDAVGRSVAIVVAGAAESPAVGSVVEGTLGIGAVGRSPSPGAFA